MSAEEKRVPLWQELLNLGDKIKKLEEECPKILDKNKWTIMRADGHTFRTFTKQFNKPMDRRVSFAMIRAAIAWLKNFHGIVAYLQSDEITLVMPPADPQIENSALMFRGRMVKLVTLSASCVTAAFNNAIIHEGEMPTFDCRAFQVNTIEEVREVIRWRQLDTFRNGISALARTCFSNKDLFHKSTGQMMEMLRSKEGLGDEVNTWKLSPLFHGIFIKKVKIDIGQDVTRTKFYTMTLSEGWQINTPAAEWLTSKYTEIDEKNMIEESPTESQAKSRCQAMAVNTEVLQEPR